MPHFFLLSLLQGTSVYLSVLFIINIICMAYIYTIIWQDKDVQSELFACIGFILQQLWPVMSLVVWACASVVFTGDLEKAVFVVFNISIYRI